MDPVRRTQIHEAGHVVIGHFEGLKVENVALKTPEAGTPGVRLSSRPGTDAIEANLAMAVAALAGPLAVAIAEDYDPAFLSEQDSAKADVALAARCVAEAFQGALFLYDDCELDWGRLSKSRIKGVLRQHWRTVEAVKDALCEPPYTLTGEQVVEIIERVEYGK
jgi:hypothetical protein